MKILIVLVSLLAVLAVAGAVIVGVQSFDGTVTENPYEKGLSWDTAERKRSELGWQIVFEDRALKTGDNKVNVLIHDKTGKPVTVPKVVLTISRPSTSDYDKKFIGFIDEKGIFSSQINFPVYGYWDLTFELFKDGDSIELRERVFVVKGSLKYKVNQD